MDEETAKREWRREVIEYAGATNAFLREIDRVGWENAGDEPPVPDLSHLTEIVLDAIRKANVEGTTDACRESWPPAHLPFVDRLQRNGQSIPILCFLPDGSLLARVGEFQDSERTVRLVGDSVIELPEIGMFGRCPNGRYFAFAETDGVRVVDGWDGPEVARFGWPDGREGAPEGFLVKPLAGAPAISRLIPFPDARRVLLIGENAIFVLSESGATRLLPTTDAVRKHFEWLSTNGFEPDVLELAMTHGAISRDGRFLAVGSQMSEHLLFDGELRRIATVERASEYPHFALFCDDENRVAFNSCHFYHGGTVVVEIASLSDEPVTLSLEDERVLVLEDGSRVYAGACCGDEILIGDADGWVRTFGTDGVSRGRFFLGSTICDMDISPDRKTLAVSTYAGYIALFALDDGEQRPDQIGLSPHRELRCWIFWRGEPKPLIW